MFEKRRDFFFDVQVLLKHLFIHFLCMMMMTMMLMRIGKCPQ